VATDFTPNEKTLVAAFAVPASRATDLRVLLMAQQELLDAVLQLDPREQAVYANLVTGMVSLQLAGAITAAEAEHATSEAAA
jgi:hypothetical protein